VCDHFELCMVRKLEFEAVRSQRLDEKRHSSNITNFSVLSRHVTIFRHIDVDILRYF
jgi:hypothetical protein